MEKDLFERDKKAMDELNKRKNDILLEINKQGKKESIYFYSRIVTVFLLNAILLCLFYLSYNISTSITKDDIKNAITSADKIQHSAKRLADYHAVLARKTSLTMEKAQELLVTSKELLGKDIPNTLTALKEEARNTSVISKSTVETINNLNKTIVSVNNDLPQLMSEINKQIKDIGEKTGTTLTSANLAILEVKELTGETKVQIKQNGDAIKELIVSGNALLVPEGSITKTMDELQKAIHGINVITNDPNLTYLLRNANITMKNLGDITYNANLTVYEIARLSKHLTDKIIGSPPKNWADKYILRPTLTVLKTVGAFGQIYYLLSYK
mgnify:CR=1 FL=1